MEEVEREEVERDGEELLEEREADE